MPVLKNRFNSARFVCALQVLTMGLWHFVSFQWAAWGVYHGTGLVVFSRWERWKKKRRKARKKAGKPAAAAYERLFSWVGYPLTFLYVALGYAFVSSHTMNHAVRLFSHALKGPFMWLTGIGH